MYQFFTVYVFFLLIKKIIHYLRPEEKYIPFVATFLYIYLYCSATLEGQLSNADNFTNLPILLAAYAFVLGKKWLPFIFIGISFLIKQNTALQAVPISLAIFLYNFPDFNSPNFWKDIYSRVRILLLQILVFLIPTLIFSLFTVYWGTFEHFIKLVFLDRISSHILTKNYDYAVRYFNPIFFSTIPFWVIPLTGIFSNVVSKFEQLQETNKYILYSMLWFVFSAISVWSGGYFFPHYFLEIVPAGVTLLAISLIYLDEYNFVTALLVSFLFAWYKQSFSILYLLGALSVIWMLHTISKLYEIKLLTRLIGVCVFILFLSFNRNQGKQLPLISKDPYTLYNNYDRSALEVAYIVKDLPSTKIFIFDYAPRIHYLSNKYPKENWVFCKLSYVDYTQVTGITAGYPHGFDFSKRVEAVKQMFERDPFDYVVVDFSRINIDMELPKLNFLREVLEDYSLYLCRRNVCIYEHLPTASSASSRYTYMGFINNEYLEIARNNKFMEMKIELKCQDYYAVAPEDGINASLPARITSDRLYVKKPKSDLTDCNLTFTNLNGIYTLKDIKW